MKREMIAFIFIFLIAFTYLSFAQQTQVEAVAAQSGYELVSDWRVLSALTIMVMVIFVAMAYGAGVALENSELQAWASTELVQVFVTAIIVFAFAAVITFLDDVTVMVIQNSNLPFTCNGVQNCAITTASEYLANMQNSAEQQVIDRLADSVKAGQMASYRAGAYATQVLLPIPLLQLSVSGSITAGYIMDIDRNTALIEQLGNLLSVMYAQRFFIEQISFKIAPIVLVLGVVARSFFLTRRLGGLLMAMGIGIMYVLPLMYVLNWITLSLTLFGDSILTPSLGACPAACAVSPPKFYLQNGEPVYDKATLYNYLRMDEAAASDSDNHAIDQLQNGSRRFFTSTSNGQVAYSCEYAALTGASMSGPDSGPGSSSLSPPVVGLPEEGGAAVPSGGQPVAESTASSNGQTASLAPASGTGIAGSRDSPGFTSYPLAEAAAPASGSSTISLMPPGGYPPGDVECAKENCDGTNTNCWCGGAKIPSGQSKYCCGADSAFGTLSQCRASPSCKPIYSCSSRGGSNCQGPVSETCHCGAVDATAGQYCCAAANTPAPNQISCQGNDPCMPDCPSSVTQCQAAVTQTCKCAGINVAFPSGPDTPGGQYCYGGDGFVTFSQYDCQSHLPVCSETVNKCQSSVSQYCKCGTADAYVIAPPGKYCYYTGFGYTGLYFDTQAICRSVMPDCYSWNAEQCQNPAPVSWCKCGSAIAQASQYCYAGSSTAGTLDQCEAALPACPADKSSCENATTYSCKCGTAFALIGMYCNAANNTASSTQVACQETLPECSTDYTSCQSGVPSPCKCGSTISSAGEYCCAAEGGAAADKPSCQLNYKCMPSCSDAGVGRCENSPGAPCRCGAATDAETNVAQPGQYCCYADSVIDNAVSCLESYSCMPNCESQACEQPNTAKCWCPSIGTTQAVSGQFCCGAASVAGPPSACLQTDACMPQAPYGNCEQTLDSTYKCGSATAGPGEYCCALDNYHTYTKDFCTSSPSCAAAPAPITGGYCPYECRELPYPMGPTCTGTILVNGQNQTAEQTKKACAKIPPQCKITRYVDLNAYPEPLQVLPTGGTTKMCPDECKTIPPLKSNCDATKTVTAFVASGTDSADSVSVLADCMKSKDFCPFTQDNPQHDLSARPNGCMIQPGHVYDDIETATNDSYGMACESPPSDSIIASKSCVYVLPDQSLLDSGACDSCLFVHPEYTFNPPIYTDCASRCGGGAAGPPKINPAEFAQRTAEGMVGRPEIKSVAALMLPAYILPLLDILVTLMFIRSFSAILGGDIDIPGLTRII